MATPVTTAEWRVFFKIPSVTDFTTYQITLAASTPQSVVDNLVKVLKRAGQESVRSEFFVVTP